MHVNPGVTCPKCEHPAGKKEPVSVLGAHTAGMAPPLESNHRCDRCPARAMTRWAKAELELFFCGHHTNVHEAGMIVRGFDLANDSRTPVPAST